MKELVGIILLTVLVVFGSCNSNTNVSLVGTSPQLFDVCQVSTGNPDYRNKELFINELKRKCKYPIEFQKNNLEAYVAIEYKTDQRGYIVKKRVAICDNKKFKKILNSATVSINRLSDSKLSLWCLGSLFDCCISRDNPFHPLTPPSDLRKHAVENRQELRISQSLY